MRSPSPTAPPRLHLSLLALNVGPGDIVLVTAYSWPATANVVELCGATPVFVDIEPDTYNLDPSRLEETLTKLMADPATASRVKAVLPIHAFGQCANMTAILACANRWNLPVIEDAACALGAAWNGVPAGAAGKLGCFSFHPRKAVTTGEGGAITTDDDALARIIRSLRNHGLDPESPTPDFIRFGFNYRLTEFQGALGSTQLQKLDRIIAERRRLAAEYDRLFAGTPITAPAVPASALAVYQSYVVRLPKASAARRGELIASLKARGVETTIGTWHMPLIRCYREKYGYKLGDFPVADAVFASALTLPLHPRMRTEDLATIADRLLAETTSDQARLRAG